MWPAPAATGWPIGDVPLGCAVPMGDVARLGVFFVTLRPPATRGQLAHVLLAIAFERGLATFGGDRDEVHAAVCVAERTAAGCAGEQAEEIVLDKVLVVNA